MDSSPDSSHASCLYTDGIFCNEVMALQKEGVYSDFPISVNDFFKFGMKTAALAYCVCDKPWIISVLSYQQVSLGKHEYCEEPVFTVMWADYNCLVMCARVIMRIIWQSNQLKGPGVFGRYGKKRGAKGGGFNLLPLVSQPALPSSQGSSSLVNRESSAVAG